MMTVAQAFEQFMQSLELHAGEAQEAKRQERNVFERMRSRLRPRESILSGSYGRNTAIRPLHDIDLFLIFAGGGSGAAPTPKDFLERVRQALASEFDEKQPKIQNRSVNIEFNRTGIGFDVVPAVEAQQPGIYWIPDLKQGTWIQSNPRKHQEACDAANERAKKKLKPLIKAIKRWNQLQGKPVPSFLLEVMAYKGIASLAVGASYAEGMAHLFSFMSEHIREPWQDPAGLGPPPVNAHVDEGHLQQGQQRLSGATRKAARALDLERAGDKGAAHAIWRELLGTDYPER